MRCGGVLSLNGSPFQYLAQGKKWSPGGTITVPGGVISEQTYLGVREALADVQVGLDIDMKHPLVSRKEEVHWRGSTSSLCSG